jgi:hypothetical protein
MTTPKEEIVYAVCVLLLGMFIGAALVFLAYDVPPIHFD